MNDGIRGLPTQFAQMPRGLLGNPMPIPMPNASTTFDPRNIPGLALWFDAADASTITLNGSAVSQWNDKSGGRRNIVQATALNQPAYTQNGLNSRAVVTFDGTSDRLLRTASDGTLTKLTRSLFIVAKLTNASGERCLFDIGFYLALTQSGTTGRWYDPAVSTFTFPSAGSAYVCSIAQDSTFGELRTNGGTPAATGGAATSSGTGAFGIGSIADGTGVFWQGDIAEVCYYTGKLSDSHRQAIEGYLAWKWGLSGNLPSGHPYKGGEP